MEVMLGDRRSDRRYDMRLPVRYRLLRGSRVLYEGTGTTVNVSRGGVAFETERFLPSGLSIQLWVEWPVLHRGREPMVLRLAGRILRCDGEEVGVRTTWHEFVKPECPAALERVVMNEPALVA